MKRIRGFALMSEEKRRKISSNAGKKAHALGRAHEWTSAEAQKAGRKGGAVPRTKRLK